MTDNRRCYTDELNALVRGGAPQEEIFALAQELLDRISGLLAVVARTVHPADYPFVVAVMELTCAHQRSLYDAEQIELVDNLKEIIERRDPPREEV